MISVNLDESALPMGLAGRCAAGAESGWLGDMRHISGTPEEAAVRAVDATGLVIALSFPTLGPENYLLTWDTLFSIEGLGFLILLMMVGLVLGTVAFAASAVSLPMLIDKPVDILTAVATSWRCVSGNTAAMAVWAILIVILTVAGAALYSKLENHALWAWSEIIGFTCKIFVPKSRWRSHESGERPLLLGVDSPIQAISLLRRPSADPATDRVRHLACLSKSRNILGFTPLLATRGMTSIANHIDRGIEVMAFVTCESAHNPLTQLSNEQLCLAEISFSYGTVEEVDILEAIRAELRLRQPTFDDWHWEAVPEGGFDLRVGGQNITLKREISQYHLRARNASCLQSRRTEVYSGSAARLALSRV